MKDLMKIALRGLLPHIILQELSTGDSYGYQLRERIRKKHNYSPSASTLYPIIRELKKDGLVTSTLEISDGQHPKNILTLTSKGRIILGKTTGVLRMGLINHMVEVQA